MSVEDPVDVLLRWESFGGTWRIVRRSATDVTISLRRCDGGEEVQQLVSDHAALLAWLDARERSGS